MDESTVTERPDGPPKALLVKAEWFWASVQNVACVDEKDYLFDDVSYYKRIMYNRRSL